MIMQIYSSVIINWHKIKAYFASILKEKGQSASTRKEFSKEVLLLNILGRFMNLGDGMINKISSNKF
jgi:hypothetical protein